MQSITIDTSSKCNTPNSRCSPITSSPSDGGTPNSGTDDLNILTDEYSIDGRNPHYTTTSNPQLPSNRTQKSSFITQTQTVRLPLPSEDSFKACIFDRKIVFYAAQDDCSKLKNKEFSSFKEFSKKFNPNETNSKKRKHMTSELKKRNNGMYLHYLLPLITMCESPTHFQYEQIDNFLMPIWKFNQITAKGLLNKQVMQQYIDTIKGNGISTPELLDNIARQLFEKKPQSLDLNELTGTYDDNQKFMTKFKEKIQMNIKEMSATYHGSFSQSKDEVDSDHCASNLRGEANLNLEYLADVETTSEDNTTVSRQKCTNSPDISDKYKRLFDEFLDSCIEEKESHELIHRINSGGCKLMVQGVSEILGIGNPDDLIDQLNFVVPSIKTDDERKAELKNMVDELLKLQGEANIHFNDAISLYKEVQSGEIAIEKLKDPEIYNLKKNDTLEQKKEKIEKWFDKKMQDYYLTLRDYEALIKDFVDIVDECGDDVNKKNIQRYVKLISAAILGVPIWSCKLTHRYGLLFNSSANSKDSHQDMIGNLNNIYISDIQQVFNNLAGASGYQFLQPVPSKPEASAKDTEAYETSKDPSRISSNKKRRIYSDQQLPGERENIDTVSENSSYISPDKKQNFNSGNQLSVGVENMDRVFENRPHMTPPQKGKTGSSRKWFKQCIYDSDEDAA